ncbi:MAG: hypothetical protein LC793_08310, partial [Thermomicrobia bacterium]|nr:hypothetical protein [Thermomicrobia bacterium]
SLGESLGVVFADNLIHFRSIEYRNQMYRIIAIRKMRQSGFDPSLREFRIQDGRIRVLPVEESGIGVMSGITVQQHRMHQEMLHDGGA